MTEAQKVIRYLEQFAAKNHFPDDLLLAVQDYVNAAAAHAGLTSTDESDAEG